MRPRGQKVAPVDKGIYVSLGVLIVVFLIYGGLKAGTWLVDSKQKTVAGQIAVESRNLEGREADKVADFQARLAKIGDNVSSKKDPNEVLGKIGQSVVPGSVASSLESASGSLTVKFSEDNFQVAAKQVLSFKKSDYFSNVRVTDISRD